MQQPCLSKSLDGFCTFVFANHLADGSSSRVSVGNSTVQSKLALADCFPSQWLNGGIALVQNCAVP